MKQHQLVICNLLSCNLRQLIHPSDGFKKNIFFLSIYANRYDKIHILRIFLMLYNCNYIRQQTCTNRLLNSIIIITTLLYNNDLLMTKDAQHLQLYTSMTSCVFLNV